MRVRKARFVREAARGGAVDTEMGALGARQRLLARQLLGSGLELEGKRGRI